MEDGVATMREARCSVHQPAFAHCWPGCPAEVTETTRALFTDAAVRSPRQRDVLANYHPRAWPNGLDDASAFVSKNARTWRRRRAVNRVLIGVTDAAPGESDECLLRAWWGKVELLDFE